MFTGSEWQDHSARRFGLAAPDAPSGGREARVSVQPFNDALDRTLGPRPQGATSRRHAPESPHVRQSALASLQRANWRSGWPVQHWATSLATDRSVVPL